MSAARGVSILGATGSIGRSTLEVVERHPADFKVVALASKDSAEVITGQALRHRPSLVALYEPDAADKARQSLRGKGIAVREEIHGILEAASIETADVVVSAVVGAAGVMPTFAAVQSGKVVALANKEALVAAGSLITEEASRTGARIIPVDSEHSAVFQVLQGQDRGALRRIVLTASGGPFFGKDAETLTQVTPEMALKHPRWKMGPKVTVDSATMMNKGLEVIEARWLFDLQADSIAVLIHPQSVVHSMVEFVDGSILAQMGPADMRLPIAYALGYPKRLPLPEVSLDLARCGSLDFFDPDPALFPCLGLAYRALRAGGGMAAIMNAANEMAVEAFLSGALAFNLIPRVVEMVMDQGIRAEEGTLSGILRGDKTARAAAREFIRSMGTTT